MTTFDESKHPRGQPDNPGKFRRAATPEPPKATTQPAKRAEAPLIDIDDPSQVEEIVASLAFAAGFEWGSNAGLNTDNDADAAKHGERVMPPDPTARYHAGFPELAEAHESEWRTSWTAGFRCGLRNQWASHQSRGLVDGKQELTGADLSDAASPQEPTAGPASRAEVLEDRIMGAAGNALHYGCIDGGHHKMWVIDQMLRGLLADEYDEVIANWCKNDDGDDFEWDVGIAP